MRKWLKKMTGLRAAKSGQTTAEYAIIVALVAVASIALILIFGDQVRALFKASSTRLHSDEPVDVEDAGASAADKEGSIERF